MLNLRRVLHKALMMAGVAAAVLTLSGCPTTDSLYGRAYSHYIHREDERALAILAEIIDRDARYTAAYLLQSTILEVRGDWAGAEKALRAADEHAPSSAVVSFNLGNIYFKKGDYQQAVEFYTRALQVNPGFNEAYINRANARMKLRDYPAALDDYEQFLSLTGREYANVRELVTVLRRDLGLGPAEWQKK